tara:strand:- start:441 stop:779 length:339 start_codon:yes stop_codon:yes gene_type:complete
MKCEHCSGTGKVEDEQLDYKEVSKQVVTELNLIAGTHYKPNSLSTRKCIIARLNEGFNAENFATVIRIKCGQWLHDPHMRPYLRPITLFGTKFESYLNEAVKPPKKEATLVY